MLLTRRSMLQASIGAVALSLTGCKNTKTTVVFVNNSSVAVTVNAKADGKSFNKTIQPGHSASQTYRSNNSTGTTTGITGSFTPAGGTQTALPSGLLVTFGQTNTFTITDSGLTTPAPVVS